jgi:hypothetical protein
VSHVKQETLAAGAVLPFVPKIKIFWFPRSSVCTRGSGICNELDGMARNWVIYRAHRAFSVFQGSTVRVIHRAAVLIFQKTSDF